MLSLLRHHYRIIRRKREGYEKHKISHYIKYYIHVKNYFEKFVSKNIFCTFNKFIQKYILFQEICSKMYFINSKKKLEKKLK